MEIKFLSNKPSAVIYDDHPMFAHSFSVFLEQTGIFSNTIATSKEKDILHLLVKLSAYNRVYFFLDFLIGDSNSLYFFNSTKRISKKIKTIVITSATSPVMIDNILLYQPAGVVSKSSGTDVIIQCIHAVENGQQFICPVIQGYIDSGKELLEKKVAFTTRELEIIQYFANGKSITETAELTHLSKFTIVNHRSNMMRKSGTKSIVDLLAYARMMNII